MIYAVKIGIGVHGSLTIPVSDPSPDSPFFVRNITGTEPVPAAINTQDFAAQHGSFYTGNHIGKRNIVLTLGLNAKLGYTTVANARSLLYGYMGTGASVKAIFYSDAFMPVGIDGWVESITPNRFSQDPEVQVSIICPKPNFEALDEKTVSGQSGASPVATYLNYAGNRITGIRFTMAIGGSSYRGKVFIENNFGELYRKFQLETRTHPSGQYLTMDSHQGTKHVEVGDTNLLGAMTDDSLWTYLIPGSNNFRVRTPNSNTHRNWQFSYREQFGGI